MQPVSFSEATENFTDLVRVVAATRQRFVVHDDEGPSVAIVPPEDLELLESMTEKGAVEIEPLDTSAALTRLQHGLPRVSAGSRRLMLQEAGKDVAAIVPRRDLGTLEGLDKQIEFDAAKKMLDEQIRKGTSGSGF